MFTVLIDFFDVFKIMEPERLRAEPPLPDARKFWIFQKVSQEICKKMDYFRWFLNKNTNPALNFLALDGKPNCVGNFWENFERFLWKSTKMHYFVLFSKKISNPCVKFSRVLSKNNCFGNFRENFQKFLWK